jgi:ATP-dependent Lon protease
MDSIDSLPLFPLSLVLYPDEPLSLHIFEERYKDLTAYCLEHEVPFGIVRADDDEERADVGTTARIDRVVKRYEDGRMDIAVRGEERFRIETVHHDEASYYTADVMLVEDEETTIDLDLKERVITQHMKLLELAGRTVRPDLYEDVDRLSFVLAQNGALESEQKQELLEYRSENERIRYLIRHFEAIIPRIEEQEGVQRRIRSNGHFKDFPPEEV